MSGDLIERAAALAAITQAVWSSFMTCVQCSSEMWRPWRVAKQQPMKRRAHQQLQRGQVGYGGELFEVVGEGHVCAPLIEGDILPR